MSITREDILAVANKKEQLDMFDYWSADDYGEKDPRAVSVQEMVEEYHQTAGLDKDEKFKLGSDLESFRFGLISEEYDELQEETYPVAILKELADLIYVCYGLAVTFGWDLDEAVRRVHENNMGRMYHAGNVIKRRGDGKIIKNPDYPKVELGDLV